MVNRSGYSLKNLVFVLSFFTITGFVSGLRAQNISQNLSLTALEGLPSYSVGPYHIGGTVAGFGLYINLGGTIGGTLAKLTMNGQSTLSLTGSGGELSFGGGSGTASMSFGLQSVAQYEVDVPGISTPFTGDIPFLPNIDLLWADNESFTPFLFSSGVTLSGSFTNEPVISYDLDADIASVSVGVSLTAGLINQVKGSGINTSAGTFSGSPIPVTAQGANLTVSDISETLTSSTSVTLTPNVSFGLTVAFISYNLDIPIVTFPIRLASADFTTNPAQSVSFTLPSYTITASAGGGGSISPSGDVSVLSGESRTFTVIPNNGYRISSVYVDGSNEGALSSYTFRNVTSNHSISASFTPVPVNYTVTASAGNGGSISPSGSISISSGGSQTFTITPNNGYQISSVYVDGVNEGAIRTFTFNSVVSGHSISASFTAISVNYTITSSAGNGGSINPSGNVSVSSGWSQTFTITPSSGYQVASVYVDGINEGAVGSYTFSNVGSNHSISASFSAVPVNCTITASAGSGGSIDPSGKISVNSGGGVTLSIIPNSGFQISSVYVDGVNEGAIKNYTFNDVTSDHTISANFTAVPVNYMITASTAIGGSISPSGNISLNSGGSQTFTITPNNSYQISSVYVDGVNEGVIDSYTFNDVTSNHSIAASFTGSSNPLISLSPSVLDFGTILVDTSSLPESYMVRGSNLTSSVLVKAPVDFSISDSIAGIYSDSLSLMPVHDTLSQVIYVRFTPGSAGLHADSIRNSSAGAAPEMVAVSGNGGVPVPSPSLVGPADFATRTHLAPVFRWDSSDGATAYRIEVSSEQSFGKLLIDTSVVSDTDFTAPVLNYSTTYYWRVTAIAQGDTSHWSTVWSFSTGGIELTLSVNVGVLQGAGVFDSTKDAIIVRGDFEHLVNPSYQDWLGNQFHLTRSAVNDSVYDIDFQMNGASAGDTIQYKFIVIDTSNGQASLSDSTDDQGMWETDRTAPGPNSNRIYVLGSENTQSAPVVYFDNMFGPVQTHDITFQADMSSLKLVGFNGKVDSISVRGSWPPLAWSSGLVMLPSVNNPNTYQATARITLPVGGILEYRFFGSPSAQFENDGWDTASSNRMINFPDHDTTLPAVDPAIFLINPVKKLNLAWKISISAVANGFVDSSSYVAADTSASDGYDSLFDLPKPPQPPANYVYVYFPHPGWNVPLGPNFMTGVKHDTSLADMAQVWTFVVATDQKNKIMTLTMSATGDSLLSYPIMLKDMKTGAVEDVRSSPIYTYNTGTDSARVFQLIVGTPIVSASYSYNPGWSMVGLPLSLTHDGVSDLFGRSAYVFGYSGGSYFAPETLKVGEGYWLGTTSSIKTQARGVQILGRAAIALSPGFNMISTPYLDTSYSESQLSVMHQTEMTSLDSAAALGWISPSIYSFDQTTGSYRETDMLSAWRGYWFAALDSDLTLVFNSPPNSFVQPAAKMAPAEQRKSVAVVSDSDWVVHINLSAGGSTDDLGAFGMKPGAKIGFDPQVDFPHPPSPPSAGGGYAYLEFPHPDWVSMIGPDFSTDIQPAQDSSPWKMVVGYSGGKTMATLSWDSASVPAGVSVDLTDLGNAGSSINMRTMGDYVFSLDGIDSFLISATLTGVNDITPAVPAQFELYQNYPNPFNPTTTIRYGLPKDERVRLEVYNVLGQRVRVLVDVNQKAGYHSVVFSGAALASGVYFYRITAGSFASTKKMLLLK